MHLAWPTFDQRPATPLYVRRQQYRKLVVLLDADVLPETDLTAWGKAYLLAGLLTLDVIECSRYADDGPPPEEPRHSDSFMGEVVPGWVVLSPDDGSGYRSARTGDEHNISDHAVSGNAPDVAAADTRTDAYSDRNPTEAAAQRRADVLAAMVAHRIGADLFITRRPYLYAMSWNAADGVTFVDIDEALAVVGLYLRAQGQYVTSRSPSGRGSHTMNGGRFFWVGTRELMPSAWRWFAGCVQHGTGGGDDSVLFLGHSVLQRVQRALLVRDEVHVGLNKPQNNDTADEALSSLDVLLLLLMGAVDATARVAHAVLGLSSQPNLRPGSAPAGSRRLQHRLRRRDALGRWLLPALVRSSSMTETKLSRLCGRVVVEPTLALHGHPDIVPAGDAPILLSSSDSRLAPSWPRWQSSPDATPRNRRGGPSRANPSRTSPPRSNGSRRPSAGAPPPRRSPSPSLGRSPCGPRPGRAARLGLHPMYLISFRNRLIVLITGPGTPCAGRPVPA